MREWPWHDGSPPQTNVVNVDGKRAVLLVS